MSRIIRGGLGLIAGYALGVVAGIALIALLSTNTHDKSLEVAMTSAFVAGPIGAVIGLLIGILRRGRSNQTRSG